MNIINFFKDNRNSSEIKNLEKLFKSSKTKDQEKFLFYLLDSWSKNVKQIKEDLKVLTFIDWKSSINKDKLWIEVLRRHLNNPLNLSLAWKFWFDAKNKDLSGLNDFLPAFNTIDIASMKNKELEKEVLTLKRLTSALIKPQIIMDNINYSEKFVECLEVICNGMENKGVPIDQNHCGGILAYTIMNCNLLSKIYQSEKEPIGERFVKKYENTIFVIDEITTQLEEIFRKIILYSTNGLEKEREMLYDIFWEKYEKKSLIFGRDVEVLLPCFKNYFKNLKNDPNGNSYYNFASEENKAWIEAFHKKILITQAIGFDHKESTIKNKKIM